MKRYLSIPIDLDKPESIDLYDELPFWSSPFGLALLDKIEYKKNSTALDIGFGLGFPLTEICMRLGESCTVYGIDPWEPAIARTRRKIKMYDINNAELIKGVAEQILLNDDSIDLIVSNNGLNNVQDLNKSLSECQRVAKKGAQFVQTINLNSSFIEFYQLLEELLKEQGRLAEIERMKQHIYSKRKPLAEFIASIQNSGFEVKSVDEHKFEYKFVDGTSMLNHFFIRIAFLNGWKSCIPENEQEELFDILEARMNKIAQKNGLFVLTVPFVVIDCRKE